MWAWLFGWWNTISEETVNLDYVNISTLLSGEIPPSAVAHLSALGKRYICVENGRERTIQVSLIDGRSKTLWSLSGTRSQGEDRLAQAPLRYRFHPGYRPGPAGCPPGAWASSADAHRAARMDRPCVEE